MKKFFIFASAILFPLVLLAQTVGVPYVGPYGSGGGGGGAPSGPAGGALNGDYPNPTLSPTHPSTFTDTTFTGSLLSPNLPPPTLSSLTCDTVSGTLAPNTYFYVIDNYDISGNESLPSNEQTSVLSGTGKCTLGLTNSPRAGVGITIFRGTTSGGENVCTYLNVLGQTTFVDDGTTSFSTSCSPQTPPGYTNVWSYGDGYLSVPNFLGNNITLNVSATVNGSSWYAGNGAPTRNCEPGDVYSNQAGGIGTSLYSCSGSNAWSPLAASSGSGAINLQGTTPGATDTGNGHISNVFIADHGLKGEYAAFGNNSILDPPSNEGSNGANSSEIPFSMRENIDTTFFGSDTPLLYEGHEWFTSIHNPSYNPVLYIGMDNEVWIQPDSSQNISEILGAESIAYALGSGHINYVNGISTIAGSANTGTIDWYNGLNSTASNLTANPVAQMDVYSGNLSHIGSGLVAEAYGIRLGFVMQGPSTNVYGVSVNMNDIALLGRGSTVAPTNYYGFYAATNPVPGVSNNWAFYAQSDPSFFGGGVDSTTLKLTAAPPTVTAGQVGFGKNHQTTVGSAGGASVLPAFPSGYLEINIDGTAFVLPYYAKS